MAHRKNTFIVIRNGEHIAVESTAEAASRKLEQVQQDDRRLYAAGWFNSDPAGYIYYILPR